MQHSHSETLYEGKHLRLQRRGCWEYVERTRTSGVVAIVAVTESRELVLTSQFRPPLQQTVIDLPAGLAGDVAGQEQESLEAAARRELEEETGYAGGAWRFLFAGPSSPGLTNERVDFFLAEGVTRHGNGGGDDSEEIEVLTIPLMNLRDWLTTPPGTGHIDLKLYIALGAFTLLNQSP